MKSLLKLSENVKILINNGIYSLYLLKNPNKNEKYVLATSQQMTYILDDKGSILKENSGDLKNFDVLTPITFLKLEHSEIIVNGV